METGKIEVVTLKAAEGMRLTQVADVPAKYRIYCRMVYLGEGDSPQNWKEVPESEARAAEAAIKAEAEAVNPS